MDLSDPGKFLPGQVYVAFSRVKSLDSLFILNFNKKAIKTNKKIDQEMQRLRDNALIIPQDLHLLLNTEYLTIGLLNVRSIRHKLHYIQQDKIIDKCHIACFTETWLQSENSFTGFCTTNHHIRNDRNEEDTMGGGVLIEMKGFIKSIVTTRLNHDGIEILQTVLSINASVQFTMILLYRSPSSDKRMAISMLQDTITNIDYDENIFTMILGDFNEDLLANATNSDLHSFLTHSNFIQYVTEGTTESGSLLDCVYVMQSDQLVNVYINDCYYSDHQWVIVQMPKIIV